MLFDESGNFSSQYGQSHEAQMQAEVLNTELGWESKPSLTPYFV